MDFTVDVHGADGMSEIRISKSETNAKLETQNPKPALRALASLLASNSMS
jgi:hypothetical protein